ncbi:MAG: phosphate signaling complex protein PhoU [Ignavibacteriales bacterium]|nr:MAG: phosphate signaling complex protein PhoU [Ignavibacteriales bacterium]
MERQFEHQIEKLRTRVIKMCSLVDEQVEFAIRSIEEENTELSTLVIQRDNKVDKFDLKIDKICQKIIALNQPVAMDLRMIMSSLTINTNLERIGDIAVNISESFLILKKKPSFLAESRFYEMAKVVKTMIRNAIDSFIDSDAKLAQKVIETDNILDNYNIENHKILIDIMKRSPDNIEQAVALLVICRQMERLGDHATNIAEDVFFIVEAQMIKHKYEKYIFSEEHDDEDDEESVSKSPNE